MKILVVGNYFYPEHIGGVEIVTFNLSKYYRSFGNLVCWVAADVPPRFRNVIDGDLPIRSWNITEERFGFPQPIPSPMMITKLYRSVTWCDVVHLHDCVYFINIIVFLLAKIAGKPILITQHTEIIPYKNKFKTWLHSLSLRTVGFYLHKNSNYSVFISENTRDNLPFIVSNIKRSSVIRNGVDTELFSPLPSAIRKKMRKEICGDPSKPILLFVGRLVAIKGIQYLLPLIEKHEEWHWLIVGRPDEYNPLEWDYSNVTFWPSLDLEKMRTAYTVADLSIHPSEVIGMSLTVLECMACGTPVLVNESVLYDVKKDDLEYFIVIKPNTSEIENAIAFWLQEPEMLSSLARKVRDYTVKQSSWQEVTKKYVGILERMILGE